MEFPDTRTLATLLHVTTSGTEPSVASVTVVKFDTVRVEGISRHSHIVKLATLLHLTTSGTEPSVASVTVVKFDTVRVEDAEFGKI